MGYNFIIAKSWTDGEPALDVYTYGSAVHFGDDETAKELLDIVKYRTKDDKYSIYKIPLEPFGNTE